jgi:hypothetical protein
MSSNAASDRLLDLDRDLPVTPEDVAALRRLRAELPSWFALDARELEALIPADALDRRPLARDEWEPFRLD